MLLFSPTAREDRLSSDNDAPRRTRITRRARLKSPRGSAFVRLGVEIGDPHDVKTGESAALLNRR